MEYMSTLQSGVDELKPSLFELIAEQQLSDLLPPSLRYLLAVATHRHPRYLLRLLNNFDEIYALLSIIVERYYLRTYSGGFTENFYGLKRERVLHVKGGELPRAQLGSSSNVRETLKLGRGDVWRNLAVMVGLPYIKRKLDESYDIHAAGQSILGGGGAFPQSRDELPPNAPLKQRAMYIYKWFLRKCYPIINAAYYLSLLVFNMSYLFDTSKYHSPFLYLIGTRIRRLGEADHKAIAALSAPPPAVALRPGQSNSILSPRVFTRTVGPRILSSLKIMLPASIFALKFLEWWHASDFARQLSRKAAEGLELPPPIVAGLPKSQEHKRIDSQGAAANSLEGSEKTSATEKQHQAAAATKPSPPISTKTLLPIFTVPQPPRSESNHCPICREDIVNATASPSGFVYCYTCIHRWVRGEHDRQEVFMEGTKSEANWGDDEDQVGEEGRSPGGSREGRWESGKGRDAVTGRRILGGTDMLRRVVV